MFITHTSGPFKREPINKRKLKVEEVIPTFAEEIPVVEDYNQESSLNEINTFLATYEEEESLGEDY